MKKHGTLRITWRRNTTKSRSVAPLVSSFSDKIEIAFQTERDDLLQQREQLSKRLESNECLLREKEDEVFLQLERVVYLEEQCDRVS